MKRHPETGRLESEEERADRNLSELLGELRIALPGVQVLFAFLLVVPFNQRFARVTDFQEKLYLATLLCAAAASAFLIAPSVHHRISFRRQDKEYLVVASNRLAVVGLTLLAIAMTGAIVLVTDVIFSATTTLVAGVLVGAVFAVLWYAVPLRRRASRADPSM
jgi:membrane-bound acyltransferase YfiQ involved in biofilm formation